MHFGSCIYSGEECEYGCYCYGCPYYERTYGEYEPCELQKLKDDNARMSDSMEKGKKAIASADAISNQAGVGDMLLALLECIKASLAIQLVELSIRMNLDEAEISAQKGS